MALTKLPKNAFGTDSVDDTKIEDGTIQNQELAGSLSEDRLATGTIANASLSNSTITINGTSISLGGSSSVGVDVNWQSVQTTGFTAVAANGYFVDTTSGAITVTLPASASLGDQIAIKDYAGTFSSNNLTIGRNGHNIQGVANDSLISTNRASLLLVYVDSTKGWIYAEESNVADLEATAFISATGGTVTTSGDYKIHTFTGDGCFVVSQTGGGAGPSVVDYMVVAGGGSGGNGGMKGGGGAGGYRESSGNSGPYTASPLATPTGITVSATTYPVTVGGGGAISPRPQGVQGSNSIFSTITSAGGGGGANGCNPAPPAASGGSGGAGTFTTASGSGNTPPVSPPQGNPGTPGLAYPQYSSGGGGGAGAAGSPASPGNVSGPGGAGTTSSINGSPVTRAGGGGGGVYAPPVGGTPGSGGPGGGGNGANGTVKGGDGGANAGGGGGGSGSTPTVLQFNGSSGGKGIVIIRYKFQ